MFVIKIAYGDTTRRLLLEEPCSFAKICGLIVNRFELKPDEVARASLRYQDPDGDKISVNTDVELQDALGLLGKSDPPLLRMFLNLGESPVTGNASWATALAAQKQADDDADSVVLVDDEDNAARATEEEMLRQEQEEQEKIALVAQQEAEEREAQRRAEEESQAAAAADEQKALDEKMRAEEERRKHEEEERLRLEMEASQVRLEEEIRELKRQEEERKIALNLKAQKEAEEEQQARILICLNQAEDDAIYRISQLLQAGCSQEQLESVYSKRIINMHAIHAMNEVKVLVAPRDGHEANPAAMEVAPNVKAPSSPSDEVATSQRVLAQVPSTKPEPVSPPPPAAKPEPVRPPPPAYELPSRVEPVVNMPVAQCLTAPAPQTPVAEPVAVASPQAVAEAFTIDDSDEDMKDLAARLGEFYMVHNPSGLDKVPQLIKDFGSRIDTLNKLLRTKYGADLSSVAAGAREERGFDDQMHQRPVSNYAPSAPPPEESEAMKELLGMGFEDRGVNQALLDAHAGDISKVINELLGA